MIGFFPDPYPDELLYGACARYNDRARYPSATLAVKRLFGSRSAAAVVDLPTRINQFLSALPPNHKYTADRLIDHHTIAPFYIPFLPIRRVHFLREEMKEGKGFNRTKGRIGATTSSIKTPTRLRFCPVCSQADKAEVGEKYWHRVHQIPGVEVCPMHATFLEDSSASWRNLRNPGKFISAEKAIQDVQPRAFDPSDFSHVVLLKIALDAAWLLSWHKHTSDLKFLRERYYNLLLQRGLAYYNGNIKMAALCEALINFYPPDLLKRLKSEIDNCYKGWVFTLVHTTTLAVVQHPIRHLLLITFLGYTAEEFFTSSNVFKPFGNNPWPCLNRASEHFGQLLINDCRVTDCWVKKKRGKPVGTFSCACGFVYNRIGPDTSEEDRYQINSVESYGPVWEKALREIWADRSISLREAARRLGVSELSVVRHAIRLELPMNVSGARHVGPKTLKRYKNFRIPKDSALELYKRDWLEVVRANPNASRRQLMTMASFLYLWLGKNAPEWLEAHLPPIRKGDHRGDLKNWNSIDAKLAPAVRSAGKQIKASEGRPVRVSLAAILRKVGHRAWIERCLPKLPRTSKALSKYLESHEEFLIRRVKWAEDLYIRIGKCPSRYYFEVHAGTRNKSGRSPAVQSAIDAAIERLLDNFLPC
ncbi:MAG: TnsD family transposase [Acidobacteriota bacterium]|nr:TnsD family transposase [Acidobacteriota bacterium]